MKWGFSEHWWASALKDRKEKGCPLALLIHLCARGGKLNNGQLSTAAFFFFVIDIKASKRSFCKCWSSSLLVTVCISLQKVLASYRGESSLDCKGEAQKSYLILYCCWFSLLKKRNAHCGLACILSQLKLLAVFCLLKTLFSLKRKEYLGIVICDPGQSSALTFWKFSSFHFLTILVAIFCMLYFVLIFFSF